MVTNCDKAIDFIHKKPLYKQPKAFVSLLVMLLIVYVVSEAARAEGPEENSIEQTE